MVVAVGLADLGGTTNVTLLGFGPDFCSRQVLKIGPLRSLVWMEDYHQAQRLRARYLEPDPVVNSGYLEEPRAASELNSLNCSTQHLLPPRHGFPVLGHRC